MSSARLTGALLFVSLFLLSGFSYPLALAQGTAGAPGPSPPMNDASAVDQGIACALMLVALLVTYLVH